MDPRPLLAALLAASPVLWTPVRASAQKPPASVQAAPKTQEREADWQNARATRRSGFTAGLVLGAALGHASGTPNDYSKIDNPAYESRTGGAGLANALWIGGALTDWFTFGLGFGSSAFGGSQLQSKGSAFLFHIETFPLFYRGRTLRDLGLFVDLGTGVGSIVRKTTQVPISEAGSFSVAGLGAFWECWRVSGFAAGPVVSWQYQSSQPLQRHFAVLGLRAAFYGGP
jgi:hypothetical protein